MVRDDRCELTLMAEALVGNRMEIGIDRRRAVGDHVHGPVANRNRTTVTRSARLTYTELETTPRDEMLAMTWWGGRIR
jgi:hypothetical protein